LVLCWLRSRVELAEQFEPSEQCIRNGVKQAERDEGERQGGLTSTEKEGSIEVAIHAFCFKHARRRSRLNSSD